ncbi:MAG: hypothetical protein R3C32_06520 [Chloroflexota bacterium]
MGGTGMDARRLERDYLRWGASPKRAGNRIGRATARWQERPSSISATGSGCVASAQGESVAHAFADDDYRDRSRLRSYRPIRSPSPWGPTWAMSTLVIGEVDRRLEPARVRARLAEVCRPLLVGGAVAMTVDRAPVTPAPWRLEEEHPSASVPAAT